MMTRAGGVPGSTSLVYATPASRAIASARSRIPAARAGPIAGPRWAPPDRNEVTARKVRCPCVPVRAAACSTALKPPSLPSMAQRMFAKVGDAIAGAARSWVCMLSVNSASRADWLSEYPTSTHSPPAWRPAEALHGGAHAPPLPMRASAGGSRRHVNLSVAHRQREAAVEEREQFLPDELATPSAQRAHVRLAFTLAPRDDHRLQVGSRSDQLVSDAGVASARAHERLGERDKRRVLGARGRCPLAARLRLRGARAPALDGGEKLLGVAADGAGTGAPNLLQLSPRARAP